VGKTRLALAAAEILDDFPDGIWFADVAPLNDQTLAFPTFARALGLREGSDRSLADVVSADFTLIAIFTGHGGHGTASGRR
jgi:predicted ATPase